MNCKVVAALVLLTLAAGAAWAQDNALGLYFSDDEFTIDTAHVNISPGFTTAAYLVLTNPTGTTVAGYEVGISCTASDFSIPVIDLTFGTNLGTNTNQIVIFTDPRPTSTTGTLLATVFIATDSIDYEEIAFGPSAPSSLPDGVPVVDYRTAGVMPCSAPFDAPAVAWLNSAPVPAQRTNWGDVKALFR